MKSIRDNFATDVTGKLPQRWLYVVMACILMSACATTKDKVAARTAVQPAQAAKSRCMGTVKPAQGTTPEDTKAGGAMKKQPQPLQNCLPKGVIEITENYPVDPEIKSEFKQAVTLLKAEEYPEAIRLLRGVTGKTSKFTGPFIDLGIAYARSGDLSKAEASLKKALELNPNHPVAMNEMGLVYRKTGRYKQAREIYQKLLTLYPDYLPAHKNMGVLCDIYIQDLQCALDQYEAYLHGKPDDKKVKIWVADVKSRM